MTSSKKPSRHRCEWADRNEIFFDYHDHEWGVPSYDDQHLFEMICLEGMQAGVSWLIILQKRESYRKLFSNFQVEKVAGFSDKKLESILKNPSIIRNRLKVWAIRSNAQAILKLKLEYPSFSSYIWEFVNHKPINNRPKTIKEIPVSTPISEAMSRDLKKRGFKFVGPVICYSFMQAVGMVNDHTCSKGKSIGKIKNKIKG